MTDKQLEKIQRKAAKSQVTVFELLLWSAAPYILCRILYQAGEIATAAEANKSGLIGSAACLLLNLFLIAKGSYRLVWKRTKKKDIIVDTLPIDSPTVGATVAEIARQAAKNAAANSGGKIRWNESDPDWMVVRDPATGAESGYRLNPETGEWTNSETGAVLNTDTVNEYLASRDGDRAWIDRQNEKQKKHETALDDTLRDIQKEYEDREREEAEKARHLQEILDKYHTLDDSPENIRRIIAREQRLNEIESARNARTGNFYAFFEGASGAVLTGANLGVDILGEATGPLGKHVIKNGYIVFRNFGSRLSEAYVYGKDMRDAARHAMGDTTVDILQSELSGSSWGKRFAVNAGGDSYKAAMQAIADGEDPVEAGVVGFFSGGTGTGLEYVLDKGVGKLAKQYSGTYTRKMLDLNREYMKGNMKKSVWQGTSQVLEKQRQMGTELIGHANNLVTGVGKNVNAGLNDKLFNTHRKM